MLTNALTDWIERPHDKQHALSPDSASANPARHVKREERILVILGNPPYDGFAGIATDEERCTQRMPTAHRSRAFPRRRGRA